MAQKVWMQTPHSGGKSVPPAVQARTRERILAFAEANHKGKYNRIDVRFRGALCYIDAFLEPAISENWPPPGWGETREQALERLRSTPRHLVRLRYFGQEDGWSLAFYKYSSESYAPCLFPSGEWFGTPEEAFEIGSVYLSR